jgi:tripartite-type tricarboxylate transporter receptor subunit TctC
MARAPLLRVTVLFFAIILLTASSMRAPALAEGDYPSRTIKIVVGFAAGGGNDIFARIIGQKLQESLGQPVIIENKVGGGGRVAAEAVAAAAPDGYTLLVGASGAMAVVPAISVRPPYSATKDFTPIAMIAAFPLVMVVNPAHPAKSVQELIAWTKANPDKANYASSSPAFTLVTELFKLKTGARGTAIPYKSSNESLVSVMGGQATLTIADPPPATPLVKGGQLRALAVTADHRLDDLPDVPTMAEAGVPGVNVGLWSGFFAPARTPPQVLQKLEAEIRRIMALPDVKEKFRAMATPIKVLGSAEFARVIESEVKLWTEVGQLAHVKLE